MTLCKAHVKVQWSFLFLKFDISIDTEFNPDMQWFNCIKQTYGTNKYRLGR